MRTNANFTELRGGIHFLQAASHKTRQLKYMTMALDLEREGKSDTAQVFVEIASNCYAAHQEMFGRMEQKLWEEAIEIAVAALDNNNFDEVIADLKWQIEKALQTMRNINRDNAISNHRLSEAYYKQYEKTSYR